MKNNKNADATYSHSKQQFYEFVAHFPLELRIIDRQQVELAAQEHPINKHLKQTIDQRSVNYLRHQASSYDSLIGKLNSPAELCSSDLDRHVLDVERRSLVALAKKRILDEIASAYPWLEDECNRQKDRDALEDNVGDYLMPFGPYKGTRLEELNNDYLIRLLGMGVVRKQLRTRVERVLAIKIRERTSSNAPESKQCWIIDGDGVIAYRDNPDYPDDNVFYFEVEELFFGVTADDIVAGMNVIDGDCQNCMSHDYAYYLVNDVVIRQSLNDEEDDDTFTIVAILQQKGAIYDPNDTELRRLADYGTTLRSKEDYQEFKGIIRGCLELLDERKK